MKAFLSTLAVTFALCAAADAQVQAFSAPVGYYTFSAKNGSNMFVPGLVTKVEYQGLVTSTSSSTINVPSGLPAGAYNQGTFATHYVEVTESGDGAEGMILDIVSNTAATIVVDATPAELSAMALANKQITVRSHATLKRVFESAEGVLAGFADGVDVYDDQGLPVNFVWDGSAWRKASDFSLADGYPLVPGQGCILNVSGDKDLVVGGGDLGHVKETPTRVTVYAGILNLAGQVNPLSGDSNTLGSLGIQGSFDPFADGIDVFSTDGGGNLVKNASYIFDGSVWRNAGTFADATNDPINFTEAVNIPVSTDKTILLPRGY